MTDEQRVTNFWNNIDRQSENECWNWLRKSVHDGYGRTTFKGVPMAAHRIAFEIYHNRPIADGMILCHSCDNRLCCNPLHLREGTHKDNSDDKYARGRAASAKGDRNGRSKITNAMADVIRLRYSQERITQTQLAKEYGLHQCSVSEIILRRTYTD
jgi:hypothetical protein